MKHILLTTLFTLTAFSASAEGPRLYNCESDSWILHYNTTNTFGEPMFALVANGGFAREMIQVTGSEIDVKNGNMGKEIHISGRSIPDAISTTYTLIMPSAINLKSSSDSVKFEATLVETTWLSTIGGPSFISGPTSHNKFFSLNCIAQGFDS